MKTAEIIQIEYRFGDTMRKLSLSTNPGISEIVCTGPGMAEIFHTDGLIDSIVSDQMVLTGIIKGGKIETPDMSDIARVL